MRRLFVALSICLSVDQASFATAEPALTITTDGQTRSYRAEELLKRPDAIEIEVMRDEGYRRPMTYSAVPLAALLGGSDAAINLFFEVKALDGFISLFPGASALNRDLTKAVAMLAVEDPAAPWPPLPGKAQSAGPFSVVWVGRGAADIRSGQWPYQIVSLTQMEPPAMRWPQLAVDASLPESDPRREGQQLFITQCLSCHKLAGGGNAEVGPDLNLPMSPTEYFTLPALQRHLRDPASVRTWPDRKMPAFKASSLSDADIGLIILYLQHKATTRK